MKEFTVLPIGSVHNSGDECYIQLERKYIPSLKGLEGYSHIQLLWWFDRCDTPSCRDNLTESKPYVKGPETLGVFATRSPCRPNPLALSCAYVTYVDGENGIVGLAYCDAEDGSPVLDIKPYTPSLDRVEKPETPQWCAHWPQSTEGSGCFDWESEFNF